MTTTTNNTYENKIIKNRGISFLILFLSVTAAVFTAVSSAKYGPGMTHDSAAYMYAAESLLKGEGMQYFGYPSPFIQWPPLYPMLLALGSMAGITPGTASIIINSLSYALIVFFTGGWMLKNFSFKPIATGGMLLILLSLPLLQVARYMWTEILFILFFLLFYIEFEKFLRKGNYGSLALAAIFSALSCVERYAGVTIIAAAGLFLLFAPYFIKRKPFKRITDAAFYGVVSALPMGIWVVRNYMVSGTLLGVRLPSSYSLGLNIKRSLESVYTWFKPESLLSGHVSSSMLSIFKIYAIILPVLLAILFAAALIFNYIKRSAEDRGNRRIDKKPVRKNDARNTDEVRAADCGNLPDVYGHLLPVAFFTVFSIIYVTYLIASATAVAFEPINSRYLIPVYLPVLLALLAAADYMVFERIKNTGKVSAPSKGKLSEVKGTDFRGKWVKIMVIALFALYLLYPAMNAAASVLACYRNGAGGYAVTGNQKNSGFIAYMNKEEGNTYYSNGADFVYTLSGIRTYYPPKKSGPWMYGLDQFKKAVAEDENSYLIWFNNGVPPSLYNLEEIKGMYKLEEIAKSQNWIVYKLAK